MYFGTAGNQVPLVKENFRVRLRRTSLLQSTHNRLSQQAQEEKRRGTESSRWWREILLSFKAPGGDYSTMLLQSKS